VREKKKDLRTYMNNLRNKQPTFIKYISGKKRKVSLFLKCSEEIKRHIYMTNGVESLNSLLDKIKARLGGYFQSVGILEINILLQIENLKENKWEKDTSF